MFMQIDIPWSLLRHQLKQNCPTVATGIEQFCFCCAVSNGEQRSWVVHSSANTFELCWQQLQQKCIELIQAKKLAVLYLRIDWVTDATPLQMHELIRRLRNTKRNYYRYGLAFDHELLQLYTEQELNANALLYAGSEISYCELNPHNFSVYQKRRFNEELPNPSKLAADQLIWQLETQGIFLDTDGQVHLLYPSGPNASRRQLPGLTHKQLGTIINHASDYLAKQVQPKGRYHYGYFPCFHRPIQTYNTLRHASSTYALIEACEFNPREEIQNAIERALQALTQQMLVYKTNVDGQQMAFLQDERNEIKLGGNALCLLALCKYTELTGSNRYQVLMQQLAAGIVSMQDPTTGRFVHVLHSTDFSVKQSFRIVYYDGEACFALLRYFAICQEERWLNAAALAFDDFIAREHWKAHDHWLSYSINELVKYRPEAKYFQFGLQNVMGHLDFVIERITTFPTLLELMMAAQQLLEKLVNRPELYHLYHSLNLEKFYFAMHQRAQHMLNGFFWPELAMFYRHPAKIKGSFFIRHHAFRIRIDDIEHYLSGYIAYCRFLGSKHRTTIPEPAARGLANGWTVQSLAMATGGTWSNNTPTTLQIDSVAVSAHGLRQHSLVMLAPEATAAGFKASQLTTYRAKITAALSESTEGAKTELPTLRVHDGQQAILDLGSFARSRMKGVVIAVTGSAGKSTMIAMLQHCLKPYGKTVGNQANANLPLGVAWNLASMPWDADFIALELAIGSIRQSSRIARPGVAIITTIGPAHLEYHKNVENIARKISRIFHEMAPGNLAVINRDLQQWPILAAEARARALKILSFGRHSEADVKLLAAHSDEITVMLSGQRLRYRLGSPGLHQVYNSLAALAVASHLQLALPELLNTFADFRAIPGRGQQQNIKLEQGQITVLDDAYNANPASMQALFQMLQQLPRQGRLLLVLGDMLELGEHVKTYHQALVPDIKQCVPDRLYLVGTEMTALKAELTEQANLSCWNDIQLLQQALLRDLEHNDLLVFKASNGIGLHKIVSHFEKLHAINSKN
ncbi:UDP-N-acetylmuramoyl-tripeptide--D-alanyl-D-alanine ligase [Alkalimonas amylolytica]|uniref:UDP-N-acetylmuramoyl-tripeptide--D-alanyl-D-alanine ligase n=1 Tax=Alkalimonas amylolytica TaxID=152573 RepID=A0A1H4F1N8_ALKAM|nr:UDP-N-acetylmuramoyl-tripeptide--D-alanyl-D-alanine ligase [Alkalimonas amylolytica]